MITIRYQKKDRKVGNTLPHGLFYVFLLFYLGIY